MKLHFDENLPPAPARALRELARGDPALVLDDASNVVDRSWRGTLDEEWMPALAQEGGWSVLSRDTKIATRKGAQFRAWKDCGLPLFLFESEWASAPPTEIAVAILNRIEYMNTLSQVLCAEGRSEAFILPRRKFLPTHLDTSGKRAKRNPLSRKHMTRIARRRAFGT